MSDHRDVVERKNWVDFPGITLRCSACVKEHAASGRKLCLLKYCDKALGYHAEQKLLRQRP